MRQAALASGLVALALAWLWPLPDWARVSFLGHMTMHVTVVAVAAPLLAGGLVGGRLDPTRRTAAAGGALVASLVELAVVWGWHAPALHAAARADRAVMVLEQASFLGAGLLLWLYVLSGLRAGGRAGLAGGAVGLFLTSMHMTLLGALIALAPRPLFGHAHGSLVDQQLGGAMMLLVGGATSLAGALFLLAKLLAADPHGGRHAPVD